MKTSIILLAAGGTLFLAGALRIPAWTAPPIKSISYGPPEGEMVVFKDPRVRPQSGPQPEVAAVAAGGDAAGKTYRNVPVLGGVSKPEFDRTMVAITRWVAPGQGCGYCHGGAAFNPAKPDYAAEYPLKQIARHMLVMTRTVNAAWTNHVGAQGVTCWSCHAGRNVPLDTWHLDPPVVPVNGGLNGQPQEWNVNAKTIRTFFPNRPDRMFLLEGLPAHLVQGKTALAMPAVAGKPFPHDRDYTEEVYVEMMQWANGLGVNCTYCHQSRSLSDWAQSPPMRLGGYSGMKMTLMLNQNYLSRLAALTPRNQLGRMGDAPMADCKTCHQGQEHPAGGMFHAVYPALIGPVPAGPANAVAAANPGIPALARAPKVGVPASDTLVEYKGEKQD